jgi:hypothetical protein
MWQSGYRRQNFLVESTIIVADRQYNRLKFSAIAIPDSSPILSLPIPHPEVAIALISH